MAEKISVFISLLAWPFLLAASGCDCDEGRGYFDAGQPDLGTSCVGTDGTSVLCEPAMGTCCVLPTGAPTCVPAVQASQCFAPFVCDEVEGPNTANGCRFTAPLLPGQLATHLDMTSSVNGVVMLSGYAPGIGSRKYGDLTVGRVQDGEVQWSIVDGVPAGVPTPDSASGLTPAATGWRGGITEPGDIVGEFNAIAFSPDGAAVSVSYFDRTNTRLKFATSTDGGTTWSVHTAFTGGDSGRYTSLAYLPDGRPAIAFLSMTPATARGVKPTSRPRVIIATSATPASATDWVWAPMAGETEETGTPTPCVASLCATGLVCRGDDGECAQASTNEDVECSYVDSEGFTQPGCPASSTCLRSLGGFECAPIRDEDFVEDLPEANGLFTSLRTTATGLALVWNNRVRRTLLGDVYDATTGTWRAQGPFAIDGFDVFGAGDAGYSADLFIDAAGNWHVAYVEGAFEELRHAQVDGTTLSSDSPTVVRTLVDDGRRPPRDRAIVGTDADIAVLSTGEVRITYQDSTHLEALVATRAAGELGWVLQGGELGDPMDTQGATGFWTCQTLIGDTSHLATWWFDLEDRSSGLNGVRLFTIP